MPCKLLGLTIDNKLKCGNLVQTTWSKRSTRESTSLIKQLKRANVPCSDLVNFYTSCVRSVTDYAFPLFCRAQPQYLQDDLIRLEKRAMANIMPGGNYFDALIRCV